MKLYKIKTLFLGKDLSESAILEYVVAEDDAEVFAYIDDKYFGNEWPECYLEREDDNVNEQVKYMVENKGDFEEEYLGEFYDQKYGWEEVCDIDEVQIGVLKDLKIINK